MGHKPEQPDFKAEDFAGPKEGCPAQFEQCLTRKATKWLIELNQWADLVQAVCPVTAADVTPESP